MATSINKLFNRQDKRNLITYSFPESKIAEEYRTIRTNVQIVSEQLKHKIFLVTSPNSGEGKSTTAANLAVSMAQQKEKVLLIDANFRHPSAHFIFNIPNLTGLSDVLTGKIPFEEAIVRTDIGRLMVLPMGLLQSNSELLTSYMMGELLQKLSKQYDKVLIDAPSVLGVAGINLLASKCDGVLLVIQKGKTNLEKAAEAKKILEFSNAKIAGVILNEM